MLPLWVGNSCCPQAQITSFHPVCSCHNSATKGLMLPPHTKLMKYLTPSTVLIEKADQNPQSLALHRALKLFVSCAIL